MPSKVTLHRLLTTTEKPFRKFYNGDYVTYQGGEYMIWGYEWSDGLNACGNPPVKYRGWFYHLKIKGSALNLYVPESSLQFVR